MRIPALSLYHSYLSVAKSKESLPKLYNFALVLTLPQKTKKQTNIFLTRCVLWSSTRSELSQGHNLTHLQMLILDGQTQSGPAQRIDTVHVETEELVQQSLHRRHVAELRGVQKLLLHVSELKSTRVWYSLQPLASGQAVPPHLLYHAVRYSQHGDGGGEGRGDLGRCGRDRFHCWRREGWSLGTWAAKPGLSTATRSAAQLGARLRKSFEVWQTGTELLPAFHCSCQQAKHGDHCQRPKQEGIQCKFQSQQQSEGENVKLWLYSCETKCEYFPSFQKAISAHKVGLKLEGSTASVTQPYWRKMMRT